MKKIILLLSVITLAFASCSKNEDESATVTPVVGPNGILLKRDVYTYNSVTKETNYTYTGNKLNRVTYFNGEYDVYIYTGDLITEIRRFNNANTLLSTNDFHYNSNNKLVGHHDLGSGVYEESFVHNSDGTISFTDFFGNSGMIYFQNGEIIRRTKNYNGGRVDERTYTYDGMNSPYKNIIGLDQIVFTFTNIDYGMYHNQLTFLFTSTVNPTDSQSSTYTFNSNNFPITRTETGASPTDVGTYQFFYQ